MIVMCYDNDKKYSPGEIIYMQFGKNGVKLEKEQPCVVIRSATKQEWLQTIKELNPEYDLNKIYDHDAYYLVSTD